MPIITTTDITSSREIASVDVWLAVRRAATVVAHQRVVIEALKSAVLDAVMALGSGAELSPDDRMDLQQVLVGLHEVVDDNE